ncbi:DUF58 domain-containing protein [Roseimicrobium sp. ORNL1]|uniref:DUF58 domain-containing protein n=1 Tax=Roseimicrobium sp. ORNL1 TaxID=2711231 RepID=UPI0013E1B737|nr:DUF58 domain-containing protein [Roseimicrobium sp. ORNL1]QIF05042.1 DUF58 domain-containing protein [Roseimicrobium sp. ORNL1]
MIVPSNRLLLFLALVGIPLFTLLGMQDIPGSAIVVAAVLMLLALALDAPSALASIRAIRVALPEMTRTSKAREFEIEAVVENPGQLCRVLRLGLPFPKELECEKQILELTLKPNTERNLAKWKVRAVERGRLIISTCYLEGTSRFGFWNGRRTVKVNAEIRVYPDLSRERNVLAPLFFRKGAIGVHNVRQIGKGREFEQLRAYVPGDSYDDIFWRGTAKHRSPITKMFQLERTQQLYVAIDASRRSARALDVPGKDAEAGIIAKTQLERFIQAALVLALAAEQQTDKFGLIIFSDTVHRIIPAGGGRGHYDVIRDVLYTLEPRVVSPDYEDAFIHIGNRLRHRSLLLFLTDLGEPWLAEQFVEGVEFVARKHVVLTHMLGQREIQPMFTRGDTATDDEALYGKLAGQILWNDLQDTTRVLKQRGVHLTSSLQENLVADVVSEYLKVKKRQLL